MAYGPGAPDGDRALSPSMRNTFSPFSAMPLNQGNQLPLETQEGFCSEGAGGGFF